MLDVVVLGLSISSSWGNGHATTYRALLREFAARGHRVTFLERDVPWYASHRDQPEPAGVDLVLYQSFDELIAEHEFRVQSADVVIVGSYVPDGVAVGNWVLATAGGVRAFYDIDTPVTLAAVAEAECEYISREQISHYDLYLSFAGGPTLNRLERTFGSPCARELYCSVDISQYYPQGCLPTWDLGYMGTYSVDRQPPLEALLLSAATAWPQGRFVIAGPQYPAGLNWPANVQRIEHLPPAEHRAFYNRQRFTLNITRVSMIRAGWSPSVRLFEAAACGVAIISDNWPGLDSIFEPGRDILIAQDAADTLRYVREMPDLERLAIGQAARQRVLSEHTASRRAEQLEQHLMQCMTATATRMSL